MERMVITKLLFRRKLCYYITLVLPHSKEQKRLASVYGAFILSLIQDHKHFKITKSLFPHLFWTIRLMFLRATYCTSGSPDSRVTSGGANFFSSILQQSESLGNSSRNFIRTFTAESTTAELAWDSRGVTRSQMLGAERENEYLAQFIHKVMLQSSMAQVSRNQRFSQKVKAPCLGQHRRSFVPSRLQAEQGRQKTLEASNRDIQTGRELAMPQTLALTPITFLILVLSPHIMLGLPASQLISTQPTESQTKHPEN